MTEPIDVVVVTYNSATVVEQLLDALPPAMGSLPFRVVVVDNSSSDATREVVAGRADCLLVEAANHGYAAGINRGVAELSGRGPILVLNPDLVLAPESVPAMASLLDDPRIGVVVPLLREPGGSTARSLRREPTLLRSCGLGDSRFPRLSEVVNDPAAYEHVHNVDWATGAVMLVRREYYEQAGGFDESFFMYSEETDFCLRARDIGYSTVFTPDAAAVHLAGRSGRDPDLYALQVLNRIRLYRRRHGLPASCVVFGLTFLREAVWAMRGSADSRRALGALSSSRRKPAVVPWPGSPLMRGDVAPTRTARRDASLQMTVGDTGDVFIASVIIPAHNEARVLERTLRALLWDAPEDFDIVVVCNGCTDDSADVARSVSPRIRVIEIPERSKVAAMRAGDSASDVFPRIHMDADVELSGNDARALARALRRQGVLAAAPERQIPTEGVSLFVRWYYDVWSALPQVRSGLFGRGVVAFTRAGLERLEAQPQLMADDLVASEAFKPHERVITPEARVIIRPPKRVRDLIRRRVRVATGAVQADRYGVRRPASRTTARTLGRLMRDEPQLIARLPVFLGVTALARRRAAKAMAAHGFTTWERDESSRE